MNAAHAQRIDRAARPWRAALVVYAAALTTGTHWPRLQLDVGDLPAPDKILHMLAFAGATFLLWRSRWIIRTWLLGVAAVAWALLDELTQAIPILGRTFSWMDVLGGCVGIAVVMSWIWALAPLAGAHTRRRRAMVELAVDEMFLQRRTWIIVAATGAAAASVTGAAAGMLVARVDPASALTAALASAALGGGFAAAAAAHSIAGRTLQRLCDDAACPACAQPNRSATFDQRGWAVCSACKGRLHAGQWLTAARVIGRIAPSSAWHAAATLAGLIGLAVAAYALLMALAVHSPWLLGLLNQAAPARITADLRLAIDLSVIGIMLAVATRVYRETEAQAVNAQDRRCMRCAHDVTATPAPRGFGHCSECGHTFVRMSMSDRAG